MDDTRVARVVSDERQIVAANAALAWIDSESRPHLIVDEGLKICWANPAAVGMLRQGSEIDERGGCLVFAESDLLTKLMRSLVHADSELVTCSVPLGNEEGHVLVRGRRLESGDEILFGLVLVRTDERDPGRFRVLDTAIGLTPAENRVLLSLLDGKDADQITRKMNVSMVTIRTHIRSIYSKLEVNSRERLFAKAMPFRI